jgi:threonine-phosphate decarboxylase
MTQFEHGGNITAFAKDLQCDPTEILDLSSNINFIKPDPQFDFNTLELNSYPNYDILYSAIAKMHSVNTNNIELFNGASSAIYSLLRNLSQKQCYIYSPAYLEYKKACQAFGFNPELINRFTDLDMYIEPHSVVIFVNPSTPEGSFYNIEPLMEKWIKKGCTIIIDESFIDFTSKPSTLNYLQSYDKLYIIKSFTKFYSSAGVRLGAIFSQEENIQKLKQHEPAWKLSVFDMHYFLHIFKDPNFSQVSRSVTISNKEYLTRILKQSKYISHIFDSSANYCMIQLQNISANDFQEKLKPYKIMIRNCKNFDFLDDSFIRIAVKSHSDIQRFEKVLKAIDA